MDERQRWLNVLQYGGDESSRGTKCAYKHVSTSTLKSMMELRKVL